MKTNWLNKLKKTLAVGGVIGCAAIVPDATAQEAVLLEGSNGYNVENYYSLNAETTIFVRNIEHLDSPNVGAAHSGDFVVSGYLNDGTGAHDGTNGQNSADWWWVDAGYGTYVEGREYTFSIWAFPALAETGFSSLWFWSSASSWQNVGNLDGLPPVWEEYTYSFTADASIAGTTIDTRVYHYGTAVIDDFTILEDGVPIYTDDFENHVGSGGGFVPPTSYTVFRGMEISGSLADFADSDDVRARYNPGFVLNSSEAPVWLVFNGNAAAAIDIQVESQAGTPGLSYTVDAWNWNSGAYDEINTQAEAFNSDQVVTFPIVAVDHVDQGGNVRSRVGWRKTGLTINFPWEVRIDQAGWNE